MTYGQTAVKTRFNFETAAAIAAAQRRKERKKLARLRTVRRVIHFIGFLAYWAILLGAAYLLTLVAMIVFICLS